MEIGNIGNLCLWCFEEMGDRTTCPHCGHSECEENAEDQVIKPGTILGGHFLIGRILGQGGFGITYLAYDLDLQVKRAIKEYFPRGLVNRVGNSVKVSRMSDLEVYQKCVDAYFKEAQSIAKFSGHPNVVQVHTIFRENGTAYFVMDYVDGISFRQYLEDRGGRIPWDEALRILKPIGEALSALHESHLLHRDIKPDNIFITESGMSKLLDFGAARYETSESTHTSGAVLTPGYAPVEQYGSMSKQGTFTDVYGLASTFYRAVSGLVPLPSSERVLQDNVVPLSKVDSRVPVSIGTAVSHGMAIHPEARIQTVDAFLKELEYKKPERNWLWAAVGLLAAIGLGFMGWKLMSARQRSVSPEETQASAAETLLMTQEAAILTSTIEETTEQTQTESARIVVTDTPLPTETMDPGIEQTREALSMTLEAAVEIQTAIAAQAQTEAARVIPTDTPSPTETMDLGIEQTREALSMTLEAAAEIQTAIAAQAQTEAARVIPTDTPFPTETMDPGIARTQEALSMTLEAVSVIQTEMAAQPLQEAPEAVLEVYSGVITEEIRNAVVGDVITFGSYEQDNDDRNGEEPIQWRVLDRKGGKLLLISQYGLFSKPYHESYVSITWENCTLRKWLNSEFFRSAFNEEEQAHIDEVEVIAEKNPKYVTTPGRNTWDRIFILSIKEVNRYFNNTPDDRLCRVTLYARENKKNRDEKYEDTGWWWLRTPGQGTDRAARVFADGYIYNNGYYVNYDGYIRPAFWLTL